VAAGAPLAAVDPDAGAVVDMAAPKTVVCVAVASLVGKGRVDAVGVSRSAGMGAFLMAMSTSRPPVSSESSVDGLLRLGSSKGS
jgi:hypothetical protein